MRRRQFIAAVGSVAATWPLAVRAQQPAMPVIGYLSSNALNNKLMIERMASFEAGLAQTGYVNGQNVAIEFRWAEYHNERLSAMAADLVQRHVTVIATQGNYAVLAAKAATTKIPIVFA